jgi:hypothetical protein
MNQSIATSHRSLPPIGLALLCIAIAIYSAAAEMASPTVSARELAGRLSALQNGTSYVRLRLEVKQPPGTIKVDLQLQIKERRTKTTSEAVYQVLWPTERKGEAVLLRKVGNQPVTGSLFTPPDTVQRLDAAQMTQPLFGSDLSYEDVLENFFAWEQQAIVGSDVVGRVSCQILESKPGKNDYSSYASVRTWVDPVRMVPLRIEKYLSSGQLARRIDSTNVAADDNRRPIPTNLTVRGQRQDSLTKLIGSRIRHDVVYTDRDFTPEGLKAVTAPKAE